MMLEWLRFIRPHTAALTWGTALLAVAASGVNIFSLTGLTFFTFAVLWHVVGFADNNLCDYEYDKDDPAKKHFPLVKGTVSFGSGDLFVKCGLVLLVIFGVAITNYLVAMIPLAIGIVTGLMYNRWSKRTNLNGVFISTCWAAVPAFTIVAITGELSYIGWLITIYIFLQVYFQITVSGCLKEIRQAKEKNLLRSLGAKVTKRHPVTGQFTALRFESGSAYIYASCLKATGILIALAIASDRAIPFILILVTILVTALMMSGGTWNRDQKLRQMSLIEILTYLTLVFAIYPTLGFIGTVFMVAAPILWFITLNKVLWGRWSSPKV